MSPNLRFYGTTTVRSNYITVKVILLSWLFHQHARGGSLGGAIHDLYGESTNKTGGRVWIALYVKKQLKVIFTIAYENMTGFFSQVHSINLVDHYSLFIISTHIKLIKYNLTDEPKFDILWNHNSIK
jgi:hypothetical protein